MYRVMVVNSNMDMPGVVCKTISDGNLIPWDGRILGWPEACKARYEAMEFFPAVIIEVV